MSALNNQENSKTINNYWVDSLPLTPNNLTYCPTQQDIYINPLTIENKYGSLLALLDAVLPSQQHNNTVKRYSCIHPHCTQSFRSRASLRFHIAKNHIIEKKQVPKSDPLYLLYAPSNNNYNSDLITTNNTTITDNNITDTPITSPSPSSSISSGMVVPQKRKWQRRTKKETDTTINTGTLTDLSEQQSKSIFLQKKNSSSPSSSPIISTPSTPSSMKMDLSNPQPKRRGRPPKNPMLNASRSISLMLTSDSFNNTLENNNNNKLSVDSELSDKKRNDMTFILPRSKKDIELLSSSTSLSSSLFSDQINTENESSSNKNTPPKIFRLVQQVIPQGDPYPEKKKTVLSLQSKTLLAQKYNPLRCPSCKTGFKRKTNVIKHLVNYHSGEECFQCVYDHCTHPKRFSTREGLIYHILRAHDYLPNDGFVESSYSTPIDEDHQQQQELNSLHEDMNEDRINSNSNNTTTNNENKNRKNSNENKHSDGDKKSTAPIKNGRRGRKRKNVV
ncbi:unnamed protein product [Cunninghamella blakesleeana]